MTAVNKADRAAMNLYVGTSGFSYKEWKGNFYPEKIAAGDMLTFYAAKLSTVELNNTFYRMPKLEMVESWKEQVPPTFRFSVKAPQRITHFKRLKEVEVETAQFLETVAVLGERLGVVLFQLPPNMKIDTERFEVFLKLLPVDIPVSFEFRHPSWFDKGILALLRDHNRALCVSDTDELPLTSIDATANWGYLRLRRVKYSRAELMNWSKRLGEQQWERAFVYFKHEDEGTGPKFAAQFLKLGKRK